MNIKLSIIIPSFKRSDLLQLGLASIRRQKVNFKYEIIVLNDGIEDDTREVCDGFEARYIFTGQRNFNGVKWQCPGIVINKGVSEAIADLILITSPEIYFVQDSILQKLFTVASLDPHTIAITKGYDDVNGEFLKHVANGNTFENFNSKIGLINLHTHYPFCLCMHKGSFLNIGGYRTDFTSGIGYDDMDFYYRLVESGYIYSKQEDLEIVHLFHNRYNREGITAKDYPNLLEKNKQIYITINNTRKYL